MRSEFLRPNALNFQLLGLTFESHRRHGCLPFVSVVCFQVEISASGLFPRPDVSGLVWCV
jgi:hypothetical protein